MDSPTDNGMIGSRGSNQYSPETPLRCRAHGCCFFGTAANWGLCTKCYKNSLEETTSIQTDDWVEKKMVGRSHDDDDSEINSVKIKKREEDIIDIPSVSLKNRCGFCNKKVGLLGFECRCEGTFCGKHRYPEEHTCRFDYRKEGKIIIEKENPICKADKITDRV